MFIYLLERKETGNPYDKYHAHVIRALNKHNALQLAKNIALDDDPAEWDTANIVIIGNAPGASIEKVILSHFVGS